MSRKISIEESSNRLLLAKKRIEILKYYSINSTGEFKCLDCGTTWITIAANVINRKTIGCPKCTKISRRKKQSLTYDFVYNYISDKGCNLISKTYENNSKNLEIMYPCGHINKLSFHNFKRDFGCRKCWEKRSYFDRYSFDDLVDVLSDNNLKFIDFPNGFISGQSKIRYSCDNGHITIRDVKYILKFPTCKKCKINERSIKQRGNGGNNWKGGITQLSSIVRGRLSDWRVKSLEKYGEKCFITEETSNIEVHHLFNFKSIFDKVLFENGLLEIENYEKLGQEKIEKIISETISIHYILGMGVPLRRDIHILFHKTYGKENNTPNQFYEFVERIKSGEIQINK